MNDHIRTDHYSVLLQLLQLQPTQVKQTGLEQWYENLTKPIRVSVIKENI